MNALLGIAHIAKRLNRPKIVESLAIKRNKQLNAQWAKEKPPLVMVAIESTDELWDLSWDLD